MFSAGEIVIVFRTYDQIKISVMSISLNAFNRIKRMKNFETNKRMHRKPYYVTSILTL